MDTTKNVEKVKKPDVDETKKRRFSLLVLMASILSLGSLAWSTWSFIDLYKVDALPIKELGGISLISLSAAATMDIVWSGTMVAQYQGQRLRKKIPFVKDETTYDFLPVIGWVEALFVAALLGYHGATIGGGAAAFAAVLPVFTKLTWTLALNGLKDPNELTEDEKAGIAAQKRQSRLTRAKADATAEQHEAEMISKQRDHEAALAEQRRLNEIEREKVQAKIEREAMERQAKFDAEQAELEGQNELKAMRQRLNARLQIDTLRTQQEISLERLGAEQELRLRAPLTIQGHVIRHERGNELEQGGYSDSNDILLELEPGMKDSDRRRAELAARYYAAVAREGSITKAQFCKANNGLNPPRLSEATAAYPVEWFVENGLATWLD